MKIEKACNWAVLSNQCQQIKLHSSYKQQMTRCTH
uniref:Uncharacterized protein n=1 Tax=Rhizophora mucronata TaxID=61149 RepID=A0A2P2QR72_RHIMU